MCSHVDKCPFWISETDSIGISWSFDTPSRHTRAWSAEKNQVFLKIKSKKTSWYYIFTTVILLFSAASQEQRSCTSVSRVKHLMDSMWMFPCGIKTMVSVIDIVSTLDIAVSRLLPPGHKRRWQKKHSYEYLAETSFSGRISPGDAGLQLTRPWSLYIY